MERFNYRKLAIAGATERSFGELLRGTGLFAQAMRLADAAHLTRPQAQSPIAYACIRANAAALASVPRYVMDGEEAVQNELSALLERPNPLMGGRKFHRALSASLDMAGGVFLFLLRAGQAIKPGQMPDAIWPVRDDLVEPVFERGSPFPIAWRTSIREKQEEFPDSAVAHVYFPDPDDPWRGFGNMQAAWRAADHLFRAEGFDDGLVENGGQIGGVFTHENRKLTQKELEAANASIAQNVSTPRNDRKKVFLQAGVTFTPTSFTQVEMQAIEMRRFKREEVMRIFGVPPAMLGELESANRSSLQEQRRIYYENTIAPLCEFLNEELYAQLILKLPKQFHRLAIKFDYAATPALREDADAQIDRVRKLVGMGVPFALAAERVGFAIDRFEGDDVPYIEAGLRTAEEVQAGADPEPDPQPEDAGDQPDADDEKPGKSAAPKAKAEDGRARREKAVESEIKRLSKAERRIKGKVRAAFDDYILAQRTRVRELAEAGGKSVARVARWHDYTRSAEWSDSAHAYARVMELEPIVGADGWTEVRGISEDELNALWIGDSREWGEKLWALVRPALLGTIEDSAQAAHVEVGGRLIGKTDEAVVAYLRTKEIRVVEGPMSVVAEQVRRALIAGLSGAPETGTLADRVREALESVEDELRALQDRLGTRASMIARTETAGASSAARLAQYESAGIVQTEWASAGDDLVRDGHDIDGELTIVGQPFSNGLRFPGDPTGSAGMVVNCRCVALPVVPEALAV